MERWRHLPLAVFEHMQFSNWTEGAEKLNAFDICDRVEPIWRDVVQRAQLHELTLTHRLIASFHSALANAVNANSPGEFRDPTKWDDLVKETKEVSDGDDMSQIDAWLLAALFWDHLPSLRLMTSWLYISALHIQETGRELSIAMTSLGSLLEKLSSAGPPLHDAEGLRGSLSRLGPTNP